MGLAEREMMIEERNKYGVPVFVNRGRRVYGAMHHSSSRRCDICGTYTCDNAHRGLNPQPATNE